MTAVRADGVKQGGPAAAQLARARVATVHASRIRRRLGALMAADLRAIEVGLREVLGVA